MYKRHVIGRSGEDIASKYLEDEGYQIIGRNFYCKQGEIDIVAKDKEEFVFVEVKTRTNENYGKPVDAITLYKQKHLIKSIEYFLYKYKLENVFIRIDVIEVYGEDENKYNINHIKNAIEKTNLFLN